MANVKDLNVMEKSGGMSKEGIEWADHPFNWATVMFHSFILIVGIITTTFALLNIMYASSVFINMIYLSVSIFISIIASLIFIQSYQIQRAFHEGKQAVIKIEGRNHRHDLERLLGEIRKRYPETEKHDGILSFPGLLRDRYHRILDIGGNRKEIIRIAAAQERFTITTSPGAEGHIDELTRLLNKVHDS